MYLALRDWVEVIIYDVVLLDMFDVNVVELWLGMGYQDIFM